jgi:hypothetical protein
MMATSTAKAAITNKAAIWDILFMIVFAFINP